MPKPTCSPRSWLTPRLRRLANTAARRHATAALQVFPLALLHRNRRVVFRGGHISGSTNVSQLLVDAVTTDPVDPVSLHAAVASCCSMPNLLRTVKSNIILNEPT